MNHRPPAEPHRPPMRVDIGKMVEFSLDGHQWHTAKLASIDYDETGPLFWQNIEGRHRFFNHCRVPYTCPDPIAELSQAADWMADHGHDEAARVLMAEIERRQKPAAYNQFDFSSFLADRWPQSFSPSSQFREFSELVARDMAQRLSIPKSLLVDEPTEPQP